VLQDLIARENYALDDRLHDEVFMKGIVESQDDYARGLTHRTGRIKEHGVINGAWVVPEDEERKLT